MYTASWGADPELDWQTDGTNSVVIRDGNGAIVAVVPAKQDTNFREDREEAERRAQLIVAALNKQETTQCQN